MKSSYDLLPGIEEIQVPVNNSVQQIYFIVLFLGSKKIWMDHLKDTKTKLEKGNSVPKSGGGNKDFQKSKPIKGSKPKLVSFKKHIKEVLYETLKDYFPETERLLFSDLLDGKQIKNKLSFEKPGKTLGYVFRQLIERKKIKFYKKDLKGWLQNNFLYYNSKTKSYTTYSDDYLHQIMHHKAGIPPKGN